MSLDAFVIMPNHVHGVLVLHKDWRAPTQRAQHAAPLQPLMQPHAEMRRVAPRSLPAIIRSFKAAVAKLATQRGAVSTPRIRQRNYYEHIVRNGANLEEIRRYIAENPGKWELDKENPEL